MPKPWKIGDRVRVTTDMSMKMPDELEITGTHPVDGETWFALKDTKTGGVYAHFSPDELADVFEPPKFTLLA